MPAPSGLFYLVTGRGINAFSGAPKEAKPTQRDRKLQILPTPTNPFPSKTAIAGAKTSASLAMVAPRPADHNLKGEARSSKPRSNSPLHCSKQRTGQSLPTKPITTNIKGLPGNSEPFCVQRKNLQSTRPRQHQPPSCEWPEARHAEIGWLTIGFGSKDRSASGEFRRQDRAGAIRDDDHDYIRTHG